MANRKANLVRGLAALLGLVWSVGCGTPMPQTTPPAEENAQGRSSAAERADATPSAALQVDRAQPTVTVEPTLAPTPLPAPSLAPALALVVDGLQRPVDLAHAGDPDTLYVVEQPGRVRMIRAGRLLNPPFLDITDRVGARANEQGLLGIAFAPDFAQSRKLFVNYTDRRGDTVVAGFLASADGSAADRNSEWIVLRIDQPYANHNGGQLKFGPDGMLYIGTGDGGSAGDPQNFAQNRASLLGKMLRIDVSQSSPSSPYRIPTDNPDFGAQARPELWAIGLRNPWRFSFDRLTGDLYIADVGQNRYEEINFQPAESRGGQNYGWRLREGFEPFVGETSEPLTDPIWQYGHDGGCSVTGGYVYRGSALPDLFGTYLYGDYCSGTIWGLRRDENGIWRNRVVLQTDLRISSFGEDARGELYVLDHRGAVYRIVGQPR